MPGAFELLAGATWIEDLLVYHQEDIQTWRQRLVLAKQLRQREFDIWIEFPSDLATLGVLIRNMLMARMSGVRWAEGWRITTILWAARAQSEGSVFACEVERLLQLVKSLGISIGRAQFPLPLTEEHSFAVDAELKGTVPLGTPIVAIAPGAKRSTNKWPVDRYAEVAEALVAQGFFVVLLGAANDKVSCARITLRVSTGVRNLAGKLSVLESCEALRRCAFVVCNDSGVQHMAAAVSTPCISIFSVRDMRGKWHPYGSQHIVLEKEVPCHTCYLEECPFDNLCIKQVQVAEVLAAVQSLGGSPRVDERKGSLPHSFRKSDS